MSEGGNISQQSAAVLEDNLEIYCRSDSLSERRGLRELLARLHELTQNRLSDDDDDVFYVIFEACNNERVTRE